MTTNHKTDIPKRIEVRGELPDGRLLWWTADVLNSKSKQLRRISNMAAVLKYEAAYGFPTLTYNVRFKNTRLLIHQEKGKKQTVSEWRACHTEKGSLGRNVNRRHTCGTGLSQNVHEGIDILRKRVVRHSQKLEALERAAELQQIANTSREKEYRERRVTEVLGFMIHRTGIELRKAPRKAVRPHSKQDTSSILEQIGQKVTQTFIRVSADSEQRVFEAIARNVYTTRNNYKTDPSFYPSYELTQLPSEGSTRFAIYFGSFSDLCRSIEIDSLSDRLQMMCRYGTSRGEGIMRVLGACQRGSALDEGKLEFWVGNSCGHNYNPEVPCHSNTTRDIPVTVRKASAWNKSEQRYETPLEMQTQRVSRKLRKAFLDDDLGKGESFEMRWRRASDVSSRTWSRAIAHSNFIVGKIEIVLPCIIVSGSLMCDEYTTWLTDTLLQAVVE